MSKSLMQVYKSAEDLKDHAAKYPEYTSHKLNLEMSIIQQVIDEKRAM